MTRWDFTWSSRHPVTLPPCHLVSSRRRSVMSSSLVMGNNIRRVVWLAIIYCLLVILAIVFATPLIWLLSTSLKDDAQMAAWPPVWIPNPLRGENFWTAWTAGNFGLYFLNTTIITISATVGQLLTASMAAFGFARLR